MCSCSRPLHRDMGRSLLLRGSFSSRKRLCSWNSRETFESVWRLRWSWRAPSRVQAAQCSAPRGLAGPSERQQLAFPGNPSSKADQSKHSLCVWMATVCAWVSVPVRVDLSNLQDNALCKFRFISQAPLVKKKKQSSKGLVPFVQMSLPCEFSNSLTCEFAAPSQIPGV